MELNRRRRISEDRKPTGIPFRKSNTTTTPPQKVKLIDHLRERETALYTHRIQRVVSHNTILFRKLDKSANEQIDIITLIVLFFCSFTDKILHGYTFFLL